MVLYAMQLSVMADEIKVRAPLADGSGQLTFTVGEYELDKLLEIFKAFKGRVIKVTVEEAE